MQGIKWLKIGKRSWEYDRMVMSLQTVLWYGTQLDVVKEGNRWYVLDEDGKLTFQEWQNKYHPLLVHEEYQKMGGARVCR